MINLIVPENWKQLQSDVAQILSEIGFSVKIGHVVETARGKIEIDVYAIDVGSIDKIQYIIECKNWENNIPQSVVHSFTTVMHETGGNIGFIVSKQGFQAGAKEFVKYTNISLVTYREFECRYLDSWFQRHFVVRIGDSVDSLSQYTEPIGSYRDRRVDGLSPASKERFLELYRKYSVFGMAMTMFEFPRFSNKFSIRTPSDIGVLRDDLNNRFPEIMQLRSNHYRGILDEICLYIDNVTSQFNDVFGGDIFKTRS